LAGRDNRIIFTSIVDVEVRALGPGRILHPADEFVGLAGHGGYDDRDLMTRLDLAFHMPRHIADAGDVGDGSPAEFHHDTRHGSELPSIADRRQSPAN